MDVILDLIGAIGFQFNDTWTTYLGIKSGGREVNAVFKFLDSGDPLGFILVGLMKLLIPLWMYASALVFPPDAVLLQFDFYLEVAVTMWNILTLWRHKRVRR